MVTSEEHLSAIFGCLKGVAEDITLQHCEQKGPPPAQTKHPYANGKKDKGIRANHLLLSCFDKQGYIKNPVSLGPIFESRGFATTTYSPTISELNRLGLLVKEGTALRITEEGRRHLAYLNKQASS